MNAPLSAYDVSALIGLPAAERYTFFLSEVIAQAKVWALKGQGGFVAFSDDDGNDCFPFWPAPELAEALADNDWSDCRAEPLELDVFMERWLTGMSKDGRLVSVFPAPDGSGIVIDPSTLLRDLLEERQQGD
jgi:hypothetical protein